MKQLDLQEIDDRWNRNREGRYFVRTWKRGESSVGGVEWSWEQVWSGLEWDPNLSLNLRADLAVEWS